MSAAEKWAAVEVTAAERGESVVVGPFDTKEAAAAWAEVRIEVERRRDLVIALVPWRPPYLAERLP